jgi:hypothetical protein
MSSFGGNFTWTYDAVENALYGLNNVELFDGDGGNLEVLVQGVSVTSGSITGFELEDFNDCTLENDGTNDSATSPLTVQAPLPVDFVKFDAFANKCDYVDLNWDVTNEINNKGFEIQRQVGEKADFQTLGFVKGMGTSSDLNSYGFRDELSGKHAGTVLYYRLKQVDYNGKFEYSDVVSVTPNCKPELTLKMSPNPTRDLLNVTLYGFVEDEVEVTIMNPNGAIVRKVMMITGSTNQVDLKELPTGVYNLQVKSEGELTSHRIIKID